MKILHVAPVKTTKDDGIVKFVAEGISNSVTKLLLAQHRHGYEVSLLSTFPFDNALGDSVAVGTLSSFSYKSLLLPFTQNLVDEFLSVDVIHSHDIYNIKQVLFLFHAINNAVPVFVSPRGAFSPVALSRSKYKKLIFRLIFNILVGWRIRGFMALNDGEKGHIRKLYKSVPIMIMHNGVEYNYLRRIKYIKHVRERYEDRIVNIGFIGRFDVYIKGLDLLLDAYIKYQETVQEINVRLTFVGEHRAKNEFNSEQLFSDVYKRLRKKDMLNVLGPRLGESKWEELAKFDILILPSRTEGMPNTVLEAMSIGVPCLVTSQTNMAEIVNCAKCGWSIEANSVSILDSIYMIDKIHKIDLIKMGANGMKYVKKYLTWDKVSNVGYRL